MSYTGILTPSPKGPGTEDTHSPVNRHTPAKTLPSRNYLRAVKVTGIMAFCYTDFNKSQRSYNPNPIRSRSIAV